jgi:hypothetical protein
VLNDTRKHHSSFKLFAYPENKLSFDIPGFPVHVLSHKDSRDNMWQLKFGNPIDSSDNDHTYQPKWNLHDNSLQTDGSVPVNKTLYFRLYDGKYPKDTENWTGPVFHPIATTMKNKKEYKNERNAKLIAKKGWSLVREDEDPFAYTLKGSDPKGNFFACADESVRQAMVPDFIGDEDPNNAWAAFLTIAELVYTEATPRKPFLTNGNSLLDKKGCFPVIIKVCRCRPALIF